MAPSPLSLVGHLHVPGGGTKPELLGRAGLGGQPEASPTPPPPPPRFPDCRGFGEDGRHFFPARTTASPRWVPRGAAPAQRAELATEHISMSESSFLHSRGTLRNWGGHLWLFNASGENTWPLGGERPEIRSDQDSA